MSLQSESFSSSWKHSHSTADRCLYQQTTFWDIVTVVPESSAYMCAPPFCHQVHPWGLCSTIHFPRLKYLFTSFSLKPQRKSRGMGVREILYVQCNQYSFNGECENGSWYPLDMDLDNCCCQLLRAFCLLWRIHSNVDWVQHCKEAVRSLAGAFGAGINPANT